MLMAGEEKCPRLNHWISSNGKKLKICVHIYDSFEKKVYNSFNNTRWSVSLMVENYLEIEVKNLWNIYSGDIIQTAVWIPRSLALSCQWSPALLIYFWFYSVSLLLSSPFIIFLTSLSLSLSTPLLSPLPFPTYSSGFYILLLFFHLILPLP